MRGLRDYSSLSSRIWFASNQLFGSRSLQREVWHDVYDQLLVTGPQVPQDLARAHGHDTWDDMLEACYGTSIEAMRSEEFPAPLRRPFAHGQAGWMPLARQYPQIRRHRGFAGVFEFTDLQLDTEAYGAAICRALNIQISDAPKAGSTIATGYTAHGTVNAGVEDVLFFRARRERSISPPKRVPIALSQFPHFIQEQLVHDLRLYVELNASPERVRIRALDPLAMIAPKGRQRITDIDPIYSYLQSVLLKGPGLDADHIRRQAPRFQPYFSMLDSHLCMYRTKHDKIGENYGHRNLAEV